MFDPTSPLPAGVDLTCAWDSPAVATLRAALLADEISAMRILLSMDLSDAEISYRMRMLTFEHARQIVALQLDEARERGEL
jgi:hypothetical protein